MRPKENHSNVTKLLCSSVTMNFFFLAIDEEPSGSAEPLMSTGLIQPTEIGHHMTDTVAPCDRSLV